MEEMDANLYHDVAVWNCLLCLVYIDPTLFVLSHIGIEQNRIYPAMIDILLSLRFVGFVRIHVATAVHYISPPTLPFSK